MSNAKKIVRDTYEQELMSTEFSLDDVSNIVAAKDNIRQFNVGLAKLLQSRDAALFVQQMFYWWRISGKKAFYKFEMPNSSDMYKLGDSWTEELVMSRHEFRSIKAIVATKVNNKSEALEVIKGNSFNSLVAYYTVSNVTYWVFNEALYVNLMVMAAKKFYTKSEGQFVPFREAKTVSLITKITKDLKEKENLIKEKENTEDVIEDFLTAPAEVVEVTHNKASKPRPKPTQAQIALFDNAARGHKMKLDYSVSSATIGLLKAKGYTENWIKSEAEKFKFYYTCTKPHFKHTNWDKKFILDWVANKKETDNVDRERQLGEIASGDFWESGPTSFRELAEEYLEERSKGSRNDSSP